MLLMIIYVVVVLGGWLEERKNKPDQIGKK